MEIKKYLKIYKDLELNKSTEDVEADIKQLQLSTKVKYYGYFATVSILGIAIYSSLLGSIKSDPFKATLIDKLNVSPAMTYFYSNYSSDLEKAEKYNELLNSKISDLKKQQIHQKAFSYKYNDFLNDVRANQSSLEFSIILNEQVSKYMEVYFLAFLQQNRDIKISLGSNEYNFIDISQKVANMETKEALEVLKVPAKTILDTYLKDISKNELNLNSLSNALYSLSKLSYQDSNFFANLKIPDNALNELKSYLLKGDSTYSLISNGYKQTIKLPKLDDYFEKEYAIKKADFEKDLEFFEINQNKIIEDLKILQEQQDKTILLISFINKLQTDVINYKSHKEKIENLLEEITWKI